MAQKQISDFKENLLFIEESVKVELQRESYESSQIEFSSKLSEKVPEVSLNSVRTNLKIDQARISFDLEKLELLINLASIIELKVKKLKDKEKYYPIKFLYEQRKELLTNISRTLKTIKRVLNKLFYSNNNPAEKENLIGKRIKHQKVLSDYIKEFNDWVYNQRLLNGNDCLLTQGLELTFNIET